MSKKEGKFCQKFVYKNADTYLLVLNDAVKNTVYIKGRFRKNEEISSVKSSNLHITFSEASEKWLKYIKPTVKISTYNNYLYLLKKHIAPFFGDIEVSGISSNEINEFSKQKLESGRLKREGGISPKYLKDMLSVVKSIGSFCEEEYNIPNKIKYPRYVKAEKTKTRVLSSHEQRKLSEYLLKDKNPDNLAALICMYTGMRIGEVCGLKWDDFDEQEKTLSIKRTVQRISDNNGSTQLVIGTPKTNSSFRTIPIPDFLADILRRMRRGGNLPIFSKNGGYSEPWQIRKSFKNTLEKCGIEDFRFHDLRHTFASNCVSLKFDAKMLSEILGHSSVSMTLNRYVHSSFEQKRKYMNMLSI